MALSGAQRTGVRRFLGYADRSSGSYSTLEGAMDVLSPEAEAVVGEVLADLATIEETLRSSWGRQKVAKSEDVTLAGHDEIIALRKEGNRLAEHLSTILGVPVARKPFTSGPNTGIAARG